MPAGMKIIQWGKYIASTREIIQGMLVAAAVGVLFSTMPNWLGSAYVAVRVLKAPL